MCALSFVQRINKNAVGMGKPESELTKLPFSRRKQCTSK